MHEIVEFDYDMLIHGQHFFDVFWNVAYSDYRTKFPQLEKNLATHHIRYLKVQKTSPDDGYHVWHCEQTGRENNDRILAFTLYLNDVAEGGETEFLYQRQRVAPQTGRLAIWPAFFTHIHRGNPPLSGDKYILTGWVEYK